MYSSQNRVKDIVFTIYSNERTVFRLNDIAMITGSSDFQSLNKKLNYYVRTKKILNPRKGIYAKPGYDAEELACNIFTPSYISLEYVLQKAGVIFQYHSGITSVSYLSREIEIGNKTFQFRKVKGEILSHTSGINLTSNHISMATPERAFLDILYLNRAYFFDNLNPLDKAKILEMVPLFQSKALSERVKKILADA